MDSGYDLRKKFIINTVFILLIIFISYVLLKYGISIVSPFIFAFIFAYILNKPARAISTSTRLPHKLVAFFIILIFYAVAGIVVFLLGVRLTSTITRIVSMIPSIYDKQIGPLLMSAFRSIEEIVYDIDPAIVEVLNEGFTQFIRTMGETVTNFSLRLLRSISDIASSLPLFFIKVLLMVISTFFIAMDFDNLVAFTRRQFSQQGNKVINTIHQYIVNTLFVVIRSYAIIMFITFIELSIGLTILGIKNSILIAFLISIFDILPVLGTGGIMVPWVIVTLLQGNISRGLGLFLVYITVTIVRNIIEPRIVGKELGIHPVVTLISMFVGGNLFGVVGVFGLPVILSLLVHLNKAEIIRVLK